MTTADVTTGIRHENGETLERLELLFEFRSSLLGPSQESAFWIPPRFTKGTMQCPIGQYVAGLVCDGSYCGSKRLLCAEPTNNTWVVSGSSYYSHCFSAFGLLIAENEQNIPLASAKR